MLWLASVRSIAAITLLLLTVVVLAIAWNQSVFSDYSRDFGSLSPAQFAAMNARMDLLQQVARWAYLALALADLALIVAAARKRAFLVVALAAALALALAVFWLISLASVGPALVG